MTPPARRPAQGQRERRAKPRKTATAAPAAPKRSQHDRLLDAVTELAARDGYPEVSIAQISSHAGVSSATFYELFDGKEACLLAAYRSVAERLLGRVRDPAPEDGDWRGVTQAVLGALLMAIRDDPDGGRLLFIEAAAGGPLIAEERKQVLRQFEGLAQTLLDGLPADTGRLDIPATACVGALRSIISRRLRTNTADQLPSMTEDMVAWLGAYAVAPEATVWSTGPEALLERARTAAPEPNTPEPARLPRGRHGLPAGVVARSQRTRIMYATAEVTMTKGYANTTVADIVAEAGVARDVFYQHFTDKQHAFLEAQQHPTQHILDVCASAYFSGESWPERLWNGLDALLGLIASMPAISHLRLVACYAAGPVAIRRAEEITRSFTIFIEEGYRYRPEAQQLPRLTSEAVTAAAFEIIQRHAMRQDFAGLPPRLPQIIYIALAPFTGPEEAIRLVGELSARNLSRPTAAAGARAAVST
jgi:AcrR family transcriptional regulator